MTYNTWHSNDNYLCVLMVNYRNVYTTKIRYVTKHYTYRLKSHEFIESPTPIESVIVFNYRKCERVTMIYSCMNTMKG